MTSRRKIKIHWIKRLGCQFAFALMLGILAAEYGGLQMLLPAVLLVAVVLLPQLRKRCYRECVLRGALLTVAGVLGAGCYVRQAHIWEKEKQELLCGGQLCICGTLIRKEQKNERWQLTLALPDYTNRVVVSAESGGFPLDCVLSVKGPVREFHSPRCEGQFNEQQYYKNKKIIGRMSAEEIVCVRAPCGIRAWREGLYRLQQRACAVYEACLPAQAAGILSAMATGEKMLLDSDVRTLFQRAGISHILAISGMHIGMIGMGIYRLLRRCKRSYVCCASVTAAVLLLYGTMIGMGVSASRAIGMFLIYLFAQCLGRGYDTCAALAVLAVVLLVGNPFLLHDVSFQFSFLAVFAVVTAGMILPKKEDGGSVYRVLYPFCAALLLQLFTLPLVAYYYYELPLYALFLNLLLLPYVGAALGFGLLGGLAGMVWLPCARLLLVPCRIVLRVYVWVCGIAERLPFAGVICGQPSGAKLLLYYGLLGILLLMMDDLKRRTDLYQTDETEDVTLFFTPGPRTCCEAAGSGENRAGQAHRGNGSMYGCLTAGAALLLTILLHVPSGGFEIDYLDVGQGDGSMFRTDDGIVCFVDGGSSDVPGVGTYRIVPFLKSKGIRRVDCWLLSHLDEDHVSGFYEVLEAGYPVGAVIIAEHMPEDEAKLRLLETLSQNEIPVITVRAGDVMRLHKTGRTGAACVETDAGAHDAETKKEAGAVLRFFAPDQTTPFSDRNGASLVCLYEDMHVRALWTGDIGEQQEKWLLAGGKLPKIDLYKAAHHGSEYSNSQAYLKALAPKLSVISCGEKNRYGHPGAEAVEHIEASGSRILYTMKSGQIRVRCSKEGLTAEGFLGFY